MTNYDLVKNMGIEEMAVTIMCPNETDLANIKCDKSEYLNCRKCTLEWLKEESND